MTSMIRVIPIDLKKFPSIDFPFKKTPSVWAPERTVLLTEHGERISSFSWLYLNRDRAEGRILYDPSSLSLSRLAVIPFVIQRLSDHFRLRAVSSVTTCNVLSSFAQFLSWIDGKEHGDKFEQILSDSELALQALNLYNPYLHQKIKSHTLHRNTAANQQQAVIQILGAIHSRNYAEEIDKIKAGRYGTTKLPSDNDVGKFIVTLTSIFDYSWRILESHEGLRGEDSWLISHSSLEENRVRLPKGYGRTRLLELAAMCFAGLVLADSGANLAQIRKYEEPEDLLEQLTDPDRVNLTQKVIKLRARGKAVPVTMTALTFTRLTHFVNIRNQLIRLLGGTEVVPFFIQCEYAHVPNHDGGQRSRVEMMEAKMAIPIREEFISSLRKKIKAVGADIGNVTPRQLRAHKQQHLVRNYGLKAAADAMGHTIATAVKAYCAAQEGVQANDIGRFMSSLHKTVIHLSSNRSTTVPIPAGACASHGNPSASSSVPFVEPDCIRTEGCFYCDNFRIHSDVEDLRKLLSCRDVLGKIGHLQGESEKADQVYESVIARIQFLICEIQKTLSPEIFSQIETEVKRGNLTRYWAVKLQQLGLLGLIPNTLRA